MAVAVPVAAATFTVAAPWVVAVEGGWRSPLEEARQKQETDQFSGFSDKAVRSAFLQKVYAILMCQLLVTGAIMATIMFVQPIRE